MTEKDAFDQWWEWVTGGRVGDFETIPAEIRDAVMMLTPAERFDREIVKEAVRRQATPRRPAGSADQYGVPFANEDGSEPVEEKQELKRDHRSHHHLITSRNDPEHRQ